MPNSLRSAAAPAGPTRRGGGPPPALFLAPSPSARLAIGSAVDDALEQAQAVAALFRASDDVTDAEFGSVVNALGFTAGMFGIGYVPIIDASDLDEFEAQLAVDHPGSFVFELDGRQLVPHAERARYHPIQFFVSSEELPAWGFNVGSGPAFHSPLLASLIGSDPQASPVLWFPGRSDDDGVVLFQPLVKDGVVVGSVAAALDVSDLVAAVIADSTHVVGIPRIIDAATVTGDVPADWVGEIAVADRTGLVALDHQGDSAYIVAGLVLLIGLIAASAFAVPVFAVGGGVRGGREGGEGGAP